MTPRVRKLVIPAAGYGTRFLPYTKAIPKEMLPIVDTPFIQLVVEDAVRAGIEQVVLITGANKRAIEDHFDYNVELEELLKAKGKTKEYEEIRRIGDLAKFIYVRQKEPLGNGHAILQAQEVIGEEPFAMLWGDEIGRDKEGKPVLAHLVKIHASYGGTVMALRRAPDGEFSDYANRFGCVDVEEIATNIYRITDIVEKPGPKKAPSHLFQMAGFILEPEIFGYLKTQKPGHSGEIVLAETIKTMLRDGTKIFGYEFNGPYFDGGEKLGFLKTMISFALKNPDLGPPLKRFLKEELEAGGGFR